MKLKKKIGKEDFSFTKGFDIQIKTLERMLNSDNPLFSEDQIYRLLEICKRGKEKALEYQEKKLKESNQ